MNQYRVKRWALVGRGTRPVLAVFRTVVRLPPAGAGAGLPARATEMPNTTRAATDRPATARPAPGTPACSPPRSLAGSRPAGGATPPGPPRAARAAAEAATAANAATPITPATGPAVVRIPVDPNTPTHTATRTPP